MAYCIKIDNFSSSVTVELDQETRQWNLKRPLPQNCRALFPEGFGQWSRDVAGFVQLRGERGRILVELRDTNRKGGPAFGGLQPNGRFDISTRWERIATPLPPNGLGLWCGLAAKVGGGAVLGAEAVAAVVFSGACRSNWCCFLMTSGRAGALLGGSGSAALVVITGLENAHELHGKFQTGTDWSVSLGPRWSSVVKGITSVKHLKYLEDLLKAATEHADDLVTVGKGVYQDACLDYREDNILVLDTPAGGGAEIGYYWWAGTVHVLGAGNGRPALAAAGRAAGGR